MEEGEIEKDHRGWQKGRTRKYGELEKERVKLLSRELGLGGQQPLSVGLVRGEYRERFGLNISEWFIYRVLREYEREKERRVKAEPYRIFVEYVDKRLREFGEVVMRVSFRGSRDSLNLLSCRYVYPFEFGILNRISAFSAQEVQRVLTAIFRRYVRPDIVIMSYHAAFGAHLSHQGCVGSLTVFLLNVGILPLYSFLEGMSGRSGLPRPGRIFSEEFSRQLLCDDWKIGPVELRDFYLEYSGRPGPLSEDIRTKNPFFMRAFTQEDLKNIQAGRFLGSLVFFCV
jgi:hypothetical protein